MSASSDSAYTGFATAHTSGTNAIPSEHAQACSSSKPNIAVRSGSLTQTQSTTGLDSPIAPTPPLETLQPRATLKFQPEAVTAVAIVAIQVQLLVSSLNVITRALLSVSIIPELLGILFAICSVQVHNTDNNHHPQPPSTLVRLALRVPTILILTGIVGLGTALVVETLETSLGAAVAMSSFLIFGVALCLVTLVRNL